MTKRAEKRLRRREQELKRKSGSEEVQASKGFAKYYDQYYKLALILPICLLVFAIGQIAYQTSTTGDFLIKDITLKGGIAITVPSTEPIDTDTLRTALTNEGYIVSVRNLHSGGRNIAYLVEVDMDLLDRDGVDEFVEVLRNYAHVGTDYSLEGTGAAIGDAFFKQTIMALFFSFIVMALIVAITFRSFVPSITIILASISDILVTLAIVNILGMPLSTAGLAAFLMLIGYSVDTNILLTNRMMKNPDMTVHQRLISAFKTGIFMSATTFVVIFIALVFTSSEVIRQIMTVLLIGIFMDQINTWIQNAGILRWCLK